MYGCGENENRVRFGGSVGQSAIIVVVTSVMPRVTKRGGAHRKYTTYGVTCPNIALAVGTGHFKVM